MACIALEAQKKVPSERSGMRPDELSILMIRAQDGDKASYAVLLVECRAIIASVALDAGLTGIVRDQMITDSLRTLHHARRTYDRSKPFLDWLNSIARRQAFLHLARHRDDVPPRLLKLAGYVIQRFVEKQSWRISRS